MLIYLISKENLSIDKKYINNKLIRSQSKNKNYKYYQISKQIKIIYIKNKIISLNNKILN